MKRWQDTGNERAHRTSYYKGSTVVRTNNLCQKESNKLHESTSGEGTIAENCHWYAEEPETTEWSKVWSGVRKCCTEETTNRSKVGGNMEAGYTQPCKYRVKGHAYITPATASAWRIRIKSWWIKPGRHTQWRDKFKGPCKRVKGIYVYREQGLCQGQVWLAVGVHSLTPTLPCVYKSGFRRERDDGWIISTFFPFLKPHFLLNYFFLNWVSFLEGAVCRGWCWNKHDILFL